MCSISSTITWRITSIGSALTISSELRSYCPSSLMEKHAVA
jgi:hypothetical protein